MTVESHRFRSLTVCLAVAALAAGSCTTPGERGIARWRESILLAINATAVSDWDSADHLLGDAWDEAQALDDETRPRALATTLEVQAGLAKERDRHEERPQMLEQALQIREEAELDLLPALYPLCDALVRVGRFNDAHATHQRVLSIVKPKAQPHDRNLYRAYAVMADAYRESGKSAAAIPYYERARTARMYSQWSGRFDVAITLDHHAQALEAEGRHEEALALRARAFEILESETYVDEVLFRAFTKHGTPVRWRQSQMPLGVYIEDPPETWTGDPAVLMKVAEEAVLEWADVVQEGVPTFELGASRIGANIRIRWARDKGEGWLGHAHRGRFRFSRQPLTHVDIEILLIYVNGTEAPLSLVRQALLHEMGHAVGLFGHSSYSGDLMYESLQDDNREITERDRETLREVYDMDIEFPPGIHWKRWWN